MAMAMRQSKEKATEAMMKKEREREIQ